MKLSTERTFALFMLLSLCQCLQPGGLSAGSRVPWCVPGAVRGQYAGNTGMLSAGLSWLLVDQRVALETSIGFVPGHHSVETHYIGALKAIYNSPLRVTQGPLELTPLSVGAVVSHTFGERFSRYQDTVRYPKGYYWWNASYRVGALHQTTLHLRPRDMHGHGFDLYFETSIWDLETYSIGTNSNHTYLSVFDVLTFGVGARILF